jgi:hypothetical protein
MIVKQGALAQRIDFVVISPSFVLLSGSATIHDIARMGEDGD